jgi:trehalose 6-phosphate phosphatase
VDFDGTLSPIVARPDQARPHPEAVALLAALAAKYAVVAVVSGRPLTFLSQHLAGAGRTELVGLYGMERGGAGREGAEESESDRLWRGVVARVADAAEAEAPAGVLVERKGLTVTLHYRSAPEQGDWVASFAARRSAETGLVAHPGKMSVEMTPAAGDKGTVLAELAEGMSAVCFIGDDHGDLPAFAELRRIGLGHPATGPAGLGHPATGPAGPTGPTATQHRVATLAVAVAGAETPVEVLESADLVVDGPDGAIGLLKEFLS